MQKAFEKIIEKLKEEKSHYYLTIANTGDEKLDAIYEAVANTIDTNILIVNQVAEEYKSTEHINCSTDTSTEEVCEWEYNRLEDGWQTDCDAIFHLDVIESDLEIVKYCPYCGKRIKVIG